MGMVAPSAHHSGNTKSASKPNSGRKQEILLSLLRKAREKKGLRQIDVAAAPDCPQTRVSKYELGTRRLDLLELREVCRVLGVSLVELVEAFDKAVSELDRTQSGSPPPKKSKS